MNRVEFDITTGETKVIQLTAEDIADLQAESVEAPSAPHEVTRYQALAALHLAGLLDAVETMMVDPATDPLTVLAWKNVLVFKRHSPMVLNMAQALGLSEQQLDDLFITASGIE